MLTLIKDVPFDSFTWPGWGIWRSGTGEALEVIQFARRFSAADLKLPFRIHVTADQRYKLYLDGEFVGLGPQRGDLDRWYFDSYDLSDNIGRSEHVLSAIIWHNRDNPPSAQISHRPMFLLVADDTNAEMISTGAAWRCRNTGAAKTIPVLEEAFNIGSGFDLPGFTRQDLTPSHAELDGQFETPMIIAQAMDHRAGSISALFPWRLHPRTVMNLEAKILSLGSLRQATSVGTKVPLAIPAHTTCCFLLDHETLTIGYPTIIVSGGRDATIRLTYQEALQSDPMDVGSKGNRNEIDERTMVGITDVFHPDGREDVVLEPLWYRCWRYLQIDVATADEGVTLNSCVYRTTGYPLTLEAEFQADSWFHRLIEPGLRTLRLCCGETFLDCPYYEQLQYIGDARIMALLTYVLSGDDRLGRQALDAFDRSRLPCGFTQARYPARVVQVIPTFSLLYIAMLDDFLMWRDDAAFVKERMFGVEVILRAFESCENADCLMGKLPQWPFVDWVKNHPGWNMGLPPGATDGNSFLISLLYVYTLQHATNLFGVIGDSAKATHASHKAQLLQDKLRTVAFDNNAQLFIDDPSGLNLSQHTNIMAILTNTHEGLVDGEILLSQILNDSRLARTTYYFSFYLFEAMYHVGRGDLIWPALQPWHDMLDNGLTTFAETPEPTRSDCHGWSAHPLYHYFASVLGVRPSAPGCERLTVSPSPLFSHLPASLGGTMMMPQGKCRIDLESDENSTSWKIKMQLPRGVEVSS